MKISIGIGGADSGRPGEFEKDVEYVLEAEKLGVDTVWSAEAWGQGRGGAAGVSGRQDGANSFSARASCKSAPARPT